MVPSTWDAIPLGRFHLGRCYQRLRQRGKPGKVALVAVMRKLLLRLHAIARRGTPLAARSTGHRRKSPPDYFFCASQRNLLRNWTRERAIMRNGVASSIIFSFALINGPVATRKGAVPITGPRNFTHSSKRKSSGSGSKALSVPIRQDVWIIVNMVPASSFIRKASGIGSGTRPTSLKSWNGTWSRVNWSSAC